MTMQVLAYINLVGAIVGAVLYAVVFYRHRHVLDLWASVILSLYAYLYMGVIIGLPESAVWVRVAAIATLSLLIGKAIKDL